MCVCDADTRRKPAATSGWSTKGERWGGAPRAPRAASPLAGGCASLRPSLIAAAVTACPFPFFAPPSESESLPLSDESSLPAVASFLAWSASFLAFFAAFFSFFASFLSFFAFLASFVACTATSATPPPLPPIANCQSRRTRPDASKIGSGAILPMGCGRCVTKAATIDRSPGEGCANSLNPGLARRCVIFTTPRRAARVSLGPGACEPPLACAARGWSRPPLRNFKIQSCYCLGGFRGGAFQTQVVQVPAGGE
jgi:hypothetical protein